MALSGGKAFRSVSALGLSLSAMAGVLLTVLTAARLPRRRIELSPLSRAALFVAFTTPGVILASVFGGEGGARPVAEGERKLSVAIVYFDDYIGDPELAWLRKGIPDMLVNDLAPSEYIDVLSMERLEEVMSELSVSGAGHLDAGVALRVARRAEADVLVTGSFIRSGAQLRILIRLQDLRNDSVRATDSAEVTSPEEILRKTDGLARSIRAALEIEATGETKLAEGVQRLKTRSVEAYRHYIQGRDDLNTRNDTDGIVHLRRAVELDPEFAHAYEVLSGAYYRIGERELALSMADKAIEYSYKLDPLPRAKARLRRIQITDDWSAYNEQVEELMLLEPEEAEWPFLHAWFGVNHLRRYQESYAEYERAMALDPERERLFLNHLAYAYLAAGEMEEALQASRRYVSMRPEDAYAYDCLGEVLLTLGRYEESERALRKALELQEDFLHTMKHLADLHHARGNVRRALDAHQSYLNARTEAGEAHHSLARFYLESGNPERALTEIGKHSFQNIDVVKAFWVRGMAELRRGNRAEAAQIAADFQNYLARIGSSYHKEFLHHLKAEVLMDKGLMDLAIWELQQAASIGPRDHAFFESALGNAYFEKGDWRRAAEAYRAALRFNPRHGPSRLMLAQTLERIGDVPGAIFEYRSAEAIWKDADPGFAPLEQARAGLAKLHR